MQTLFLYFMQIILNIKRNYVLKRCIRSDMKIIGDFGCGHFPNKFANVLVDSAKSQDEQRGGLNINTGKEWKTFYDLDLNVFPYPFANKHFDFIICSHVLEHLEDPIKVCSEFSRIAKSGYIEVPFYCVDLYIKNNDIIHKWLCAFDSKNNSLVFTHRRSFLNLLPSRGINQVFRFLLQLENIALIWKDEIHARYLELKVDD